MIRLVPLLITFILLTGCTALQSDNTQSIDSEILSSIQTKRCTDFRWYGTNRWILTEDGWDGGGTVPYDVCPSSSEILSHAHAQVLTGAESSRLIQNPRLLYPLFNSTNADIVLTALYCYQEMPLHDKRTENKLISTDDLRDLGLQLRKLLSKHRDERVRCMPADLLRKKVILEINDIDLMLSDKNLSVQIVGIESAYLIRNLVEFGFDNLHQPTDIGVSKCIENEEYYALKKQLIPILIKHLNDNHFYIRAACYSSFLSFIERRRPSGGRGYTVEKPKTLPKRIQWEHESWWECRSRQQELVSWWKANGEHVLRNYGLDWIPPTN
jgi:hypothetical protein